MYAALDLGARSMSTVSVASSAVLPMSDGVVTCTTLNGPTNDRTTSTCLYQVSYEKIDRMATLTRLPVGHGEAGWIPNRGST